MLRVSVLTRFRGVAGAAAASGTVAATSSSSSSSSSTSVSKTSNAVTSSSSSSPLSSSSTSSSSPSSLARKPPANMVTKRSQRKVTARLRPRFENFQYMLICCAIGMSMIALQHFVRQGWERFRGRHAERKIMAEMSTMFEVHEDWSVALLYSTLRQASEPVVYSSANGSSLVVEGGGANDNNNNNNSSSNKTTKKHTRRFGFPFLADPRFKKEIAEVEQYLLELKENDADYSELTLPDLWVCATLCAFRALGGPSVAVSWGRSDEADLLAQGKTPGKSKKTSASSEQQTEKEKQKELSLLRFSLLPSLSDSISCSKLAQEYVVNGFSTPEIVALQGIRSLACHGETGDEQLKRLRDTVEARIENNSAPVPLPEAPETVWGSRNSCGVLNLWYFQHLLEGTWEEQRKPLSNLDGTKKQQEQKESGLSSWFSSSSSSTQKNQTGEQQQAEQEEETERVWYQDKSDESAKPILCMDPRDVDLLQDAYFAGWVHKFGTNEVEFLRVLGEAVEKATKLGWRDTNLEPLSWW